MANKEHLRILKQGVTAWNQWRVDHPNERIDLTGAHFLRADLTGARLTGANLTGALLSGAHLTGANLIGADLTRAHLSGADLTGAHLSGAHLTGANLTGARLTRAHLSGANLTGANLFRASLIGADLTGARLTRADLSYAILSRTVLGDTDLTDAKGLDSCTYYGSSILDHQTLTKSGRLPPAFLRGCGLPEILIDHIPAFFLDNPIEFYSCFISYSTADRDFAERLHADLQNKGVQCWFAPEDMKTGDRIRLRIDEAIRVHEKLLLILSKTSMVSQWVEQEVEHAMELEKSKGSTVLFPVRIDQTVMNSTAGWAAFIKRTRHIGDFTEWKDHDAYQCAFARLLHDLKPEDATNPS